VADPYITEVIHRLGTTENDDGELVLADYADLDTRHLGTIYEGLLEHEFRIAPEQYAAVSEDGGQVWKPATEVNMADTVESVDEGSLYVVNDDGERKVTGAYYTPDYVVSYIVEETIDPLLDEIRTELEADGLEPSDQAYFGRFYSQLLDLKILDPAMGSAHFLTNATGYLTEQVMEIVREQELQGRNEQELRRTIAKECIYGVDINGMAVELGKLSMWLETLAADKPLAFLDHHIKTGNSLVGSDITEVLSEDNGDSGGQLTLTQSFARARQQTLEHVMDLMEDLLAIDNDRLSDIKSMEELYDEIRDDSLYQRLFEIANVHTAGRFGLDVPEGVYEEMAGAIDDGDEWEEIRSQDWFASAQATADDQSFFHWELEYPEVFFAEDGEKRDDAGFDAVVGNPPWVRSINLKQANKQNWRYLKQNFEAARSGEYDIYLCFAELGLSLINTKGEFGYIIPNKWFTSEVGENLRRMISGGNYLTEIIDFGSHQLFDGITTYSCLIFLNKENTEEITVSKLEDFEQEGNPEIENGQLWQKGTVASDSISEESWSFNIGPVGQLFERLEQLAKLGDHANIFKGVGTNADTVYLLENRENGLYSKELDEIIDLEEEILRPALKGNDIDSYHYERDHRLLFPYEIDGGDVELLTKNRLKESHPQAWHYLERVQETLESRESGKYRGDDDWYRFGRPQNMTLLAQEKAVLPDVVNESTLAFDSEGRYILDTAYGIISDDYSNKYLTSVLNSDLLTNFLHLTGTDLRGGYFRMKTAYLNPFPIPDIDFTTPNAECESRISDLKTEYHEYIEKDSSKPLPQSDDIAHDFLATLTDEMTELKEKLHNLNFNLLDHLGNHSEGQSLADIGLIQPPAGAADSILQETTEKYPNLRVGTASVVRESSSTVEVQLTARYKPEELAEDVSGPVDDREADRWGYTETDPLPALRITDLTETEADLIEAFVPVAVDEAGGFANFRETATKTNSLVDRLHKLTLPAVSDVETGLKSYMQIKERSEELEAKIEQTDELIDEIVYELYGLTDEEIEIVEEAVST
jgi:type I restriction-modification system DNA methylase subunit